MSRWITIALVALLPQPCSCRPGSGPGQGQGEGAGQPRARSTTARISPGAPDRSGQESGQNKGQDNAPGNDPSNYGSGGFRLQPPGQRAQAPGPGPQALRRIGADDRGERYVVRPAALQL